MQLHATVIGARLLLIVPDGVSVVVNTPMLLGRRRGGTPLPAGAETPVIKVKDMVLGSKIIVRTPPRSRRFGLRPGPPAPDQPKFTEE